MNSNLANITPHLVPVEFYPLSSEKDDKAGSYFSSFEGFIEIHTDSHYIKVDAVLNKKHRISAIQISCEPSLLSLIRPIQEALQLRLQNCITMNEVISELKSSVESHLKKASENDHEPLNRVGELLSSIELYQRLVDDLETVGWAKDANESLTEIVLVYSENGREHDLKIHIDQIGKREPRFEACLPSQFKFGWNQNSSLVDVYAQFMDDVNSYSQFWDEMELLDSSCWILEPIKPSRADCLRRISVESNVSMQIRVDARNPREIPEIVFLGNESLIEKFKTKYDQNLNEWNPNIGIMYNLEDLLDMKLPNKQEMPLEDLEIECGICYAYSLNGQGPSIYCETSNCSKSFHENCLYEWLKNSAKSRFLFGYIYGECPYCKESIKCKILANESD